MMKRLSNFSSSFLLLKKKKKRNIRGLQAIPVSVPYVAITV